MTHFVRIFVFLLVALLVAAAVITLGDQGPAVEAAAPPAAAPLAFAPLPSADAGAGPALLARSPFAPDRSAYLRPTIEAPVVVERAPEVRLVGVFAVGGALRATLLIDGVELTVGVGDITPAGAVVAIEADSVTLGESERRTVRLFD